MKSKKEYKLIDGNFKPSEAIHILFTLFNSKINYHNLQSFKITELAGSKFENHKSRADELKEDYLKIKKIINQASEQGCDLKIKSTIEIKPITPDNID